MKQTRGSNEDLTKRLEEMEVGGVPLYDAVSTYSIYRIPEGYIWRSDYAGMCFVPSAPKKTMAEKKVEKPVMEKKVVQK